VLDLGSVGEDARYRPIERPKLPVGRAEVIRDRVVCGDDANLDARVEADRVQSCERGFEGCGVEFGGI